MNGRGEQSQHTEYVGGPGNDRRVNSHGEQHQGSHYRIFQYPKLRLSNLKMVWSLETSFLATEPSMIYQMLELYAVRV